MLSRTSCRAVAFQRLVKTAGNREIDERLFEIVWVEVRPLLHRGPSEARRKRTKAAGNRAKCQRSVEIVWVDFW